MISISVLHPDKYQSDQIIKAVDYLIQKNHAFYHGFGDQISIRVIDQPFTSIFPVSPNIPFNLILGFLFGLIFSLSYIFLFPEEVYNLRFWPKRKAKKVNFQIEEDQSKQALQKKNNQNLERLYSGVNENTVQQKQAEYQEEQQNNFKHEDSEDDFVVQGSMQNLGVNDLESD